ncbi:WG repeat-containing protein [uncultured Psychrobacter sp.]|uniref:WG repeat-containing protein n=1 Tax=uncultured Psychrobacter sp. TaxID=259303 RepID=UPI002604658E|nr:WG repeat-containing protein [uncultured Psychrobacter sp.]
MSILRSTPNTLSALTGRYLATGMLMSAGLMLVMPSAQAASCKLPKSYYKNVSCTANSRYFLAVKDFGAPVALINKQGKRVVDLSRYQQVDADKLAGGLIPVERSNKVGYVNMKGREVVPLIYDKLGESSGWARAATDGRIVVKKGGKYGVIDTANNIIVPFSASISDIDNYKGGKARVRKGQAISWLDKNGNTISDPSPVSAKNNTNDTNNDTAAVNRASFTTLQADQRDGKWGFVDDRNITMITYSFDAVRPFSEGLAGVRIDGKWGFVNLGGELVIPFRFEEEGVASSGSYREAPSFVFKQGKAWIGSLQNGDKMCIDKAGTNVGCD